MSGKKWRGPFETRDEQSSSSSRADCAAFFQTGGKAPPGNSAGEGFMGLALAKFGTQDSTGVETSLQTQFITKYFTLCVTFRGQDTSRGNIKLVHTHCPLCCSPDPQTQPLVPGDQFLNLQHHSGVNRAGSTHVLVHQLSPVQRRGAQRCGFLLQIV